MTRVEANARQLIGWLMPLVDKLRRKCEGNPKVAADIGDDLDEVMNAMMNLGKALDEAGVPKPNIGVEVVSQTTRDGANVTFAAGVRMRPLSAEDEAKLGLFERDGSKVTRPITASSPARPDEFDKRFAPERASLIRQRANAIRKRLHNAIADNSPGDRIEDRRIDPLIDELGIVLAEVSLR